MVDLVTSTDAFCREHRTATGSTGSSSHSDSSRAAARNRRVSRAIGASARQTSRREIAAQIAARTAAQKVLRNTPKRVETETHHLYRATYIAQQHTWDWIFS